MVERTGSGWEGCSTRVQGHVSLPAHPPITHTPTNLVNVRVDEGHVVITGDAVAQGGQPLVDALHHHLVRQRVADVHQLCTSRVGGKVQGQKLVRESVCGGQQDADVHQLSAGCKGVCQAEEAAGCWRHRGPHCTSCCSRCFSTAPTLLKPCTHPPTPPSPSTHCPTHPGPWWCWAAAGRCGCPRSCGPQGVCPRCWS